MKKCLTVGFLVVLIQLLNTQGMFGQSWSTVGLGTNGSVYAFAIYNGNLIAGGNFTTAGGVSANNIAQWNGTSWSPLGNGFASPATNGAGITVTPTCVYTLAVYNGKLYAGGAFHAPSGPTSNYSIARWDGIKWDTVGIGMSGNGAKVLSSCVYKGKLYIGGDFYTPLNSSLGIYAKYCAKWNDTIWSKGVTGGVDAMGVSNGCLYGGFGKDKNDLPCGNGAGGFGGGGTVKWNDTTAVADSGPGCTYALTSFNGSICAGGTFVNTAAGILANNIAQWNGTAWANLGWGVNNSVYSLGAYHFNLYAGGAFTNTNGNPVNHIAQWDGTNWLPLGSGLNDSVTAMIVYNGNLFVGGGFTSAGGYPASHIAQWSSPATGIQKNDIPADISIYPNPSSGLFTINISNPFGATVEIYNVVGEMIYRKQILNSSTNIDLSLAGKGMYFYRILSEEKVTSAGKISIQ